MLDGRTVQALPSGFSKDHVEHRTTCRHVRSNSRTSQNRGVLGSVLFADAKFIFAKRHIQYPVQSIFDSPMRSYRAGEFMDMVKPNW
jgi:hypothetical protein